jgi:hypothetical protein
MTAVAGVWTTLTVPERFRGPEGTANGGWIAGTLATSLPSLADPKTVEVTLRRPVPLETELMVERVGDAAVLSLDGRHLAEALPVAEDVTPPPFLPFAEAARAEEGFAGYRARHWRAIAGCFACGQREPGDGLRIFPGPVGDGLVAAGWRVPINVTDEEGVVPDSIVWAALDCVTGWAHAPAGAFPASAERARPALLGRLTGRVYGRVYPLGKYSVVGRAAGRDGRKLYGESALYEADGTLVAAARAVWILPK